MSTGPVIQGLDTITAAMESNIIPDQEYLLQGSILDTHVDVLTHRLRGLCDNVIGISSPAAAAAAAATGPNAADASLSPIQPADQFSEREMVFSIRSKQAQPLELRIRKQGTEPPAKDTPDSTVTSKASSSNATPWQLRYLGQPEVGQQRPTLVRSCYDIACSDNAVEFLTNLGFRLEWEYVSKGLIFRKGRMKITVSKIFKIFPVGTGHQPPPSTAVPNGPTEALEPLSGSHLIELSVLAPSGSDAVAEDMKNFADQLKPLVFLDKLEPRRQGM